MNQRSLATLVLLNAVLLAALVVFGFDSEPAAAQDRGGGNFVMIAGEVSARGPHDAVYILNTRTAEVLVLRYDSRRDQVQVGPGRSIRRDLEQADRWN